MCEIKAVYGFSDKLEPFAGQTIAQHVDTLSAWGVNVVFGGYQRAEFVRQAHQAGLRVFAEFGCFVGDRWWTSHPTSRPICQDGSPLPRQNGYAGVTPSHPQVRQALLDELAALVSAHELDGVWLDFIRWSSRWESPQPTLYQTSFDRDSVERFCRDAALDWVARSEEEPAAWAAWILSEHCQAWIDWKCQQITSWVAQARQVVDARAKRPCLLGMFAVPWTMEERDRALTRIMGQDLSALASLIDVFSPMVYHRMCGQTPAWIAEITGHVAERTAKPVWPIIQTMSEPDPLSDIEFGQAIQLARSAHGSESVILFTLQGILKEQRLPTMIDALR